MTQTNSPKLRRLAALAGFLLVALAVPSFEGCLLPQDEGVVYPVPEPINTPPVITQALVPADRVGIFYAAQGNCDDSPSEFQVVAVDLDKKADGGTDDLETQWAIDGDEDGIAGPSYPGTESSHIVSSPNQLKIRLRNADRKVAHLVQVLVTDGHFDPKVGVIKPNGKAPAYSASYSWWITVQDRTQCP